MKRDWNKDSRLLTPTDAKQVVAIYRAAYGVASAKNHTLIKLAGGQQIVCWAGFEYHIEREKISEKP